MQSAPPASDSSDHAPSVVATPGASSDARGLPALLRGASAGPALLLAIFALEIGLGVQLSMMGVHDEELQKTVLGRFGAVILRQQLAIFVAYAAVGLALGVAGALVLSLWERARGRGPGRFLRFVEVLFVVASVLAWRLAISIVRYPQLYVETLYAKGGARRALQTTLTDHVPASVLVGGGWLLVALLVLGPAATKAGRAALRKLPMQMLGGARRGLAKRGFQLAIVGLLVVGMPLAWPALLQRSKPAATAEEQALEPTTKQPAAALPEGTPNFLLLAVDSLRADRVGPGHEEVAPNLAALGRRGVFFEQAHVTIPRTFPSWTTLLSGRYPAHHGLRHMFPTAKTRAAVGPLLPQLLAIRGFHTAVVSDFSGEIFSRMPAGFGERRVPFFDMKVVLGQAAWNLHPTLFPFVASALGHRLFPALAAAPENADPDRLADAIIDTLEHLGRSEPFFVTAFFSTPHFPYAAPDPYYRRFARPGYRGNFRYHKPVAAFTQTDSGVSDEDVAQIRGLYDGAVASVDAAIGRVLGALAAAGLDRNTIVVLLADHGEGLFELGRGMGHGEHLHGDAMLHIPLVIYDPVHAFPAHHVPGIVRDVDLAPTLLSLAGLGPLEKPDGVDLGPMLRGNIDSFDSPAFAETGLWMVGEGAGFEPDERLPYAPLPGLVTVAPDDDIVINPSLQELVVVAKHRAIRTERWKLIYRPTRSGVRLSLYDLKVDPDELKDVAMQHPEVRASLEKRLYDWMTLDGSTVEAGFVVPRP